jgi:hypothetical protein
VQADASAGPVGHRGAGEFGAVVRSAGRPDCLGGLVERNITGRHLIDELDRLAVDRR